MSGTELATLIVLLAIAAAAVGVAINKRLRQRAVQRNAERTKERVRKLGARAVADNVATRTVQSKQQWPGPAWTLPANADPTPVDSSHHFPWHFSGGDSPTSGPSDNGGDTGGGE